MALLDPLIGRAKFDTPVAVIGDIHGCRPMLEDLLQLVGNIPLVVAGDICDHGPDTAGVIDLLIARGALGVRGNHEEWLTSWVTGRGFDAFALSPKMGGRATLDSYGVLGKTPRDIEAEAWRVPQAHRDWLVGLPLALDLQVAQECYWVIHSGLPPCEETMANVQALVMEYGQNLLWPLTPPDKVPWCGRTVIMGHYVVLQPIASKTVIALDTGAGVLGDKGRLSAVILPGRTFRTVGNSGRCNTGK